MTWLGQRKAGPWGRGVYPQASLGSQCSRKAPRPKLSLSGFEHGLIVTFSHAERVEIGREDSFFLGKLVL